MVYEQPLLALIWDEYVVRLLVSDSNGKLKKEDTLRKNICNQTMSTQTVRQDLLSSPAYWKIAKGKTRFSIHVDISFVFSPLSMFGNCISRHTVFYNRGQECICSRSLVLNLGLLRSFGLQVPEAFTSCPDWGFWELQFKSIRVTKVKNHCSNPYFS